MLKFVARVHDRESTEKAIKAIGEELIRKAADISNDIENVTSIEIKAKITLDEVVNVDVVKNYIARLEEEEKEK